MNDALHGALNSTEIEFTDREEANGNIAYNEFSTPYENRYNVIQDEVRGAKDDGE